MFNHLSNVPFNNKLFSLGTIDLMHESMARLYEAAKALRNTEGQSAVARLLIESPQTLNNWESRGISRAGAIKAQEVVGCDASWVLTGKGAMVLTPIRAVDAAPQQELFGTGIAVPVLAAAASMGAGSEQHDDVVVGRLTLSPSWVSKTLKPLTKLDNLRFIHGYGDSMEPTFYDGDILLVDAGIREIKVDGIYVLEANDRLYIKRVRQRMDASFEGSRPGLWKPTLRIPHGRA